MPEQDNRRREKRMEMTSMAAVLLACGERSVEAFLTDLSRSGAGFRIEECPEGLDLTAGDEVSGTLKTVYGESEFRAKIAWTKADGPKINFGVEILDTPEADNPPA